MIGSGLVHWRGKENHNCDNPEHSDSRNWTGLSRSILPRCCNFCHWHSNRSNIVLLVWHDCCHFNQHLLGLEYHWRLHTGKGNCSKRIQDKVKTVSQLWWQGSSQDRVINGIYFLPLPELYEVSILRWHGNAASHIVSHCVIRKVFQTQSVDFKLGVGRKRKAPGKADLRVRRAGALVCSKFL